MAYICHICHIYVGYSSREVRSMNSSEFQASNSTYYREERPSAARIRPHGSAALAAQDTDCFAAAPPCVSVDQFHYLQ